MSRNEDKRRARQATARERGRRQRAAQAARHRAFDEYLFALGASERVVASDLPATLWKRRNHPPTIAAHLDPISPDVETVLAELRAVLINTTYTITPSGPPVALEAFFTDYVPTVHACRAGLQSPHPMLHDDCKRLAVLVLEHSEQNIRQGLRATIDALDTVLLRHCQINGWIYSLRYLNDVEPSGRSRLTITLECHAAVSESFVVDGKRRPAWRCGLPFALRGIQWASWTADVRGADESADALDIYIQSHALQHLYERVPIERWAVQDWMWQSLNWPVLVPQCKGRWLVEFRFAGRRLGYFTAAEMGSNVVITTFLFLTMEGTPEGEALRRRLKLCTTDIDWLNMDTFDYFVRSDVASDPALAAILTECGCGHLFDLLKPGARVAIREGAAENTRRYLEIPLPNV